MMGSSTCVKWNKHGTLTRVNILSHHGLMYRTKVWWSGSTNMCPDPCALGINLTLSVIKDTDQILEDKYIPQRLGKKGIKWVSSTVSLMLRMCRPIFGSGKAVVLDSWFCVAKVISEIESKGVYVEALINKRRHWMNGVPGNLILIHFEDKEVDDVGMMEARTEDNKLFKIFCMKKPD